MDVISYLYNNKIGFEEFVKALLPHESIHQWTLGLSNGIENGIEFIDEGSVESEARRISNKYSIDSIPLRMTEVAAITPLVANMTHNQKIQMMLNSSYEENFRQYFPHIDTLNRYISKAYSSSSSLLIDRFADYDAISSNKVAYLAESLVNGNNEELVKIKEHFDLESQNFIKKYKIPSPYSNDER